ncbi:MAG: methylmalonic aciduria and homocystinuria type D protein [Aphanocapsa lilacina HA4352-LM1]|nr:methylmalonic aciduria and homocystinuria type D protein [Aphanocapsa lilacina HA4352-LM1]
MQILWYPAAGLFRGDWRGLLPGWPEPPNSLALFFQGTGVDLCDFSDAAEQAKDAARERFIAGALGLARTLHRRGYRATVFDPIDGLPVATRESDRPRFWSTANWSDIRAVRTVTGFPIEAAGGCHVVVHPQYGRRVYIGSLVCSALYIELMGMVSA